MFVLKRMTSTEQFLSRNDGLYGASSTNTQDGDMSTMVSMAMQTQFPSWNMMQKTKRKHSNHQRHRNKLSQTNKNSASGYGGVTRPPNDADTSETQGILTAMKTETKVFFQEDNKNNNTVNSSGYGRNSIDSCAGNDSSTNKKTVTHQENDQFICKSPSRYKGNRRGTYVAEYDPRATLNQRRSYARSKSLFTRADESGASDLHIKMLLKSFHLNQDGGESSLTASSDEELCRQSSPPSRRNSKETELAIKSSPSPSQRSATARRCLHKQHCKNSNNNKQQRAHSTFNNLSKEHLKYLEQKFENSQSRALAAQRTGSFGSDDDTSPFLLHEACKQGNLGKLKQLVDEEAYDIQSIDSRGHTPCYYAILNGHFECVSLLVSKGADLYAYFNEQKIRYFRC